jgi:hypothetical protein
LPDKDNRVATGYFDGNGLILGFLCHRKVLRRIVFELFQEYPVRRDLRLEVPVGVAAHSHSNRARGAVPGQPDDADINAKVFSSKLGAQSGFLRGLQQPRFDFQIPEGVGAHGPFRRQTVEISRAGQLDRFQDKLGRGPSDDHGQIIGRAGGRAQSLHLGRQVSEKALRIKDGLAFLEEVGLV